jgi:transcriptional regulator with XRE-family HTH domain
MSRKSIKEDKNCYFIAREEVGLSREKASEASGVSADRINDIETNPSTVARPDEICRLAEIYKEPKICNHYCTHDCEIGKKYENEVTTENLTQITLEMLSSINSAEKLKERLIEICADGQIEGSELKDFVKIRKTLKKISIAVESLVFWEEKMIKDGKIDEKLLAEYENEQ